MIILTSISFCGEIESQVLNKVFKIDSCYSISEIAASRLSPEGDTLNVWYLNKFYPRGSFGKGIYITQHRSKEGVAGYEEVNLYSSFGNQIVLKNKLIKSSYEEPYYFIEPIRFNYYINLYRGDYDEFVQLIIVRAHLPGTGDFYEDYIYKLTKDNSNLYKIEKIEYSVQPFYSVLPKGLNVWKGPSIDFNDSLKFIRSIWKETDANCCPTGGSITGNYKIVKKADAYYFEIENFKIEPNVNVNQ